MGETSFVEAPDKTNTENTEKNRGLRRKELLFGNTTNKDIQPQDAQNAQEGCIWFLIASPTI